MSRALCDGLMSSREQCLSCPYEDCVFDNNQKPKEYKVEKKKYVTKKGCNYILRRELVTLYRGSKVSYVTGASGGSSSDIKKAMRCTYEEAKVLKKIVEKTVSNRTRIKIVRKDEEIERITKESSGGACGIVGRGHGRS